MVSLNDPVTMLYGVGDSYAKRLQRLDITSLADLLEHYPHRWQDFSQVLPIAKVQPGQTVTIQGQVNRINNQYRAGGKSIQRAQIQDDSDTINVTWFNQPYLTKTFSVGTTVSLSGQVKLFRGQKSLTAPAFEVIKNDKTTTHTGKIVPIYPETYGLSSKWLRRKIKTAFSLVEDKIKPTLPKEIRQQQNFIARAEALKKIHFPQSESDYQQARQRLAFEELLQNQLRAQIKKIQWQQKNPAVKINPSEKKIDKFINQLPFKLTASQKKVNQQIAADMNKETAMNRLLCGDVGSGKTIVAIIAAYRTYLNNKRTLLMAPTEVLAQQHWQTFQRFLPDKISIGLATGRKKTDLKADIVVGTHALLHQDKISQNVALIVVDEQHRFGVKQRLKITQNKEKTSPHVLNMTATPIPRSVALLTYGNLDLSYLKDRPQGRKKVKTWVVPNKKRSDAYQWIRKKITAGAQAFIICPLIEESDQPKMQSLRAAKSEYQRLSEKVFPKLALGLLHGQLSGQEKDQTIKKFAQGKIDILVTTSVIEVGLDIPNATVMMIEGANRFGLAQLHQLRGRVGRSNKQSYCLLFAPKKSGQNSLKRLKVLERTYDGLQLARIDLKQRGPGEVFGTHQHGFPQFKLAQFSNSAQINQADRIAKKLVKKWQNGEKLPSALQKKLKKYKIQPVAPN